jgi:hypothetical protein
MGETQIPLGLPLLKGDEMCVSPFFKGGHPEGFTLKGIKGNFNRVSPFTRFVKHPSSNIIELFQTDRQTLCNS